MQDFMDLLKMVSEEQEHIEQDCGCCGDGCGNDLNFSELYNWPIKLTQMPADDYHFHDCDLLLAADCTAFAYAQFHERFIKDRVALIFCPQEVMASKDKLIRILKEHKIHSFELVIMDKPCCESAVGFVNQCIQESHCKVELQVVRINSDGEIVKQRS